VLQLRQHPRLFGARAKILQIIKKKGPVEVGPSLGKQPNEPGAAQPGGAAQAHSSNDLDIGLVASGA
jgi:hypothetical protein